MKTYRITYTADFRKYYQNEVAVDAPADDTTFDADDAYDLWLDLSQQMPSVAVTALERVS
jgi:hypothetical protein